MALFREDIREINPGLAWWQQGEPGLAHSRKIHGGGAVARSLLPRERGGGDGAGRQETSGQPQSGGREHTEANGGRAIDPRAQRGKKWSQWKKNSTQALRPGRET